MKKGLFVTAIIILSAFTLWSRYASADLLGKPVLGVADYNLFTNGFKIYVVFIALSLLSMVIFLQPAASETAGHPLHLDSRIKGWITGFTILIIASSLLVVYANPEGRYPSRKRDGYISIAARSIKPELYKKLEVTPDVIIFGSSAAFTIRAEDLKPELGLDAFNMALNGGGPVDFVTMMNFILGNSPDNKIPSVITVELLGPSLSLGEPTQTPLELISYLPWDQASPAVFENLDYAIRLTPVSDSIFSLMFLDRGRWNPRVKFTKNGTGIRAEEDAPAATYQSSLKWNVGLVNSFLSCKEPDASGKDYIRRLVQLGNQHKFSIVFYLHPINSDFYEVAHVKPSAFATCKREFLDFMGSLTDQNPNLFFADLSQYKPITTGGSKVYIDTHHLTRYGSALLLQALEDPIQSAVQWTRENRP